MQDAAPPDIEFDMEGLDITEDADFGAPELDDEEVAALVAVSFVVWAGIIILGIIGLALSIYVAYIGYATLELLPEPRRPVPSFVPWLLLVPLVNLAIIFIIFVSIPKAAQEELIARGQPVEGDCGRGLGIAGAVLWILGCTAPIGMVLMLIATMKLAQAKRQLAESQPVGA
ncbi:MAG: hypothetical protein D6753_18580 [Planctomycetota bacterium]|nr:MAG: hypothetical protein D6753_18580 [Planctomycetota bacterium]